MGLLLVLACTQLNSRLVAAETLVIQLRNGTSLTVEIEPQTLNWTNVLADGQMTSARILLSDVERLWITNEPASEQVAEVRKLLSQLGSPIYEERESAEKQLSDSEIGGPYRRLIELQKDHEVFEVRYRIHRILAELSNLRQKITKLTKFDRILMKNGSVLDGDAGEFRLKFKYAGRSAEFGREQLQMVGAASQRECPDYGSKPIAVQLVHDHEQGFYQPAQTTIHFEFDTEDNELKKYFDVSDTFAKLGVKFSTELQGYVGISGYEFKFAPEKPAGGNSVCVCDTSTSFSKRFKGVLEVRFCIPGQPYIAAGVLECGLLLARVNHNRDFLMEAYNSDGHMLASVEAVDDQCVFLGVKSNEPIAFIRVLSNPYLYRVSRPVDEDYAVDSVCFSTPKPIAIGHVRDDVNLVRLQNGDQILATSIRFTNDRKIEVDVESFEQPFVFAMAKVREVHLANPLRKQPETWLAMLEDGSVVTIHPENNRTADSFSDEKIKPQEVVGITRGTFRYPVATDFEFGSKVLVIPSCRIATESVELTANELIWDEGAKKIIQPIYNLTDPADDDDPTPQSNRIELANAIPSDIPTIWFSNPKTRDSRTGLIQLTDGQQFALASPENFEIADLNSEGLTIAWRGKSFRVSWSKVKALQFPPVPGN